MRITADYETLMKQAASAGHFYFEQAAKIIKEEMLLRKLDNETLKSAIALASVMEREYSSNMSVIAAQMISDKLEELTISIRDES